MNLALAEGLPAHGWTCEVVVPGDGAAVDALRTAEITVLPLTAGASLQQYGKPRPSLGIIRDLLRWWVALTRHLRRGRSRERRILLAYDQRGLILGAVAARCARVPLVWCVHSAEQSAVLRHLGTALSAVVVAPLTRTAARMPGRRTRVVPNGIPSLPLAPPAPLDGAPSVLTVGRLHPDKGLTTLLDAVARLRSKWPDLHLSIVGGVQAGHEQFAEELHAHPTKLGIQGAVSFVGERVQPFDGADQRTIYVQSSVRETFGMALAEAMVMGLPVVATTTDGAADLVDGGRTGLLVPPHDPVAMADAIDRLLRDDALARKPRRRSAP